MFPSEEVRMGNTVDVTIPVDAEAAATLADNPDEERPADALLTVPVKLVCEKLGMTQAELATLLRVPLGTLRNWEQDRFGFDPACRPRCWYSTGSRSRAARLAARCLIFFPLRAPARPPPVMPVARASLR
jgi:hypothetical protein